MDVYDIVAKEDQQLRFHDVVKEGQVVPQGDIYLIRLADLDKHRTKIGKMMQKRWPEFPGFAPIGPETNNLQLAPGTTIGSRHSIRREDKDVVKIYRPSANTSPIEGPVIVASGRFVLEHPEHANHSCPEGIYQVTYQRDFGADRLARVQD